MKRVARERHGIKQENKQGKREWTEMVERDLRLGASPLIQTDGDQEDFSS